MTQKMIFDDVAEYERFNKMYNDYIQNGIEASKALAMTKEAFWPSKNLSEKGRKLYDDYIFKYGLSPEDAYILASRKGETKEKADKIVEKKKAESNETAVQKWLNDWTIPADRWLDTLKPFNKFFDDSFFKEFGMPCWLDWNGRRRNDQNKEKKGSCKCGCEDSKPALKGENIVNDEIKKVLGDIPKEEVNEKNTKVKIVKNDPNDYEYKVDHTSPDGKSNFYCHKIFKKF